MILTLNVPIIPIWGLILILIISLFIIIGLIFLSIKWFKYYNLNGKISRTQDFISKDNWFFSSLKMVIFLLPVFIIIPIIVMNIVFFLGNL